MQIQGSIDLLYYIIRVLCKKFIRYYPIYSKVKLFTKWRTQIEFCNGQWRVMYVMGSYGIEAIRIEANSRWNDEHQRILWYPALPPHTIRSTVWYSYCYGSNARLFALLLTCSWNIVLYCRRFSRLGSLYIRRNGLHGGSQSIRRMYLGWT